MELLNRLGGMVIVPGQFLKLDKSFAHDNAYGLLALKKFGGKEISLKTSDNVKINAMLLRCNLFGRLIAFFQYFSPFRERKIVIYVPGNAMTYESFGFDKNFPRQINKLGCDLLLFNYRGVNKSEGHPTTQGLIKDLNSAIDYVKNGLGYKDKNISVLGQSLGGAIAIKALSERKDCKITLVNDRSFSSISNVIENMKIYRIVKGIFKILVKISGWNLDVTKDFENLKGKKIILKANNDDMMGEKGALATAVKEKNTFRISGGHNDMLKFSILKRVLR